MIAVISWAAGGALVDCQGCHGGSLLPNTLKKIFLTLLEDCCVCHDYVNITIKCIIVS